MHQMADQSSSFGYKKVVTMILESAAIYTTVRLILRACSTHKEYMQMSILYIFLYAFHSDAINLLIFSISQIQVRTYFFIYSPGIPPNAQGIAQLLIIVRFARGQDISEEYVSRDVLPQQWEPEVEMSTTCSV